MLGSSNIKYSKGEQIMRSGNVAPSPLPVSNAQLTITTKPTSTNQNSPGSSHLSRSANQASPGSGHSPRTATHSASGSVQSLSTSSHGDTSLLHSPSTTVPELDSSSANITATGTQTFRTVK